MLSVCVCFDVRLLACLRVRCCVVFSCGVCLFACLSYGVYCFLVVFVLLCVFDCVD